MLATVSALVAFDGWPRGYGTNSVEGVSVNGGSLTESQVLRTTVHRATAQSTARGAAPAGFVKTPAGGLSAGSAGGLVKTIGPVGLGGYSGPRVIVAYPPPSGPSGSASTCGSACSPPGGPLPQVQGPVCGAAGAYAGPVCGGGSQLSVPPTTSLPSSAPATGGPPAQVQVPQVQVQVPPVQAAPVPDSPAQAPQG
jgi:hypothetical protein